MCDFQEQKAESHRRENQDDCGGRLETGAGQAGGVQYSSWAMNLQLVMKGGGIENGTVTVALELGSGSNHRNVSSRTLLRILTRRGIFCWQCLELW